MIKYEISYIDKKDKSKKRTIAYMEAENLVELYKLLENKKITHITDIQEVK